MNWPLWISFLVLILLLLALDLGVLNRKPHVVSAAEAFGWTAFWIALAVLFNGLIYVMYENHWLGVGRDVGHQIGGQQAALDFFTAYLVEKSLSLDNIFVIAMIFAYFQVPAEFQHRVLFWGILGALALRGVMIAGGLALVSRFAWMMYVFGGLLVFTAAKMLVIRHDNLEPERAPLLRLMRRICPTTEGFRGPHFFVRQDGRLLATPLCLALALVESSDVLFAIDSIPAVFAITRDPFIVFTSNVFAILGLRSLYFALAAVMHRFRYLKMSLVFLLAFIGMKMIVSHHYPIPTAASLAMIAGILLVGILASILGGKTDTAQLVSPLEGEVPRLAEATASHVHRVFALVAGSTLMLVATVLLVAPPLSVPAMAVGLAVLGVEFAGARAWIRYVRRSPRHGAARERGADDRPSARPDA